jgi:hypothetical protein
MSIEIMFSGGVVIFMTRREYILGGATLGHQKPAENLVKN